ncbi:MAG TPA: ribosome maturation factor RimM [Longimicrobiales bacterium]|nr:ribosome maturation factor RimM [Longimicrobiales bacterium]
MSAAGAAPGDEDVAGTPEHLIVGHLAKVHGTKGELFIWPLTDTPERIFAEGETLLLGDEHGGLGERPLEVVVERSRPFKKGVLVKLEGFEDRNAVEPLARRYVLAETSRTKPLEEGEVFYHQLLGLEVITTDGQRVGRVHEVFETEPAHLLEVRGEGKTHLIPFVERIIKKVEPEAGRLVIKPPPGLLEI